MPIKLGPDVYTSPDVIRLSMSGAKKEKAGQGIRFIESMECLAVPSKPEGAEWSYEIKLDGFRLEAVKKRNNVTLYSRRGNILNKKFPYIAEALKDLPNDTVLDGESSLWITRVAPTSISFKTLGPPRP